MISVDFIQELKECLFHQRFKTAAVEDPVPALTSYTPQPTREELENDVIARQLLLQDAASATEPNTTN